MLPPELIKPMLAVRKVTRALRLNPRRNLGRGATRTLGELVRALIASLVLAGGLGCATTQLTEEPRIVPGQSLVVVQLQRDSIPLEGGRLVVINLETKRLHHWPVRTGGWVGASVLPGRYLIVKHEQETWECRAYTTMVSRITREIRCEFAVSQPDCSVFLGTLDLAQSPVRILAGTRQGAQQFCQRLVPDHARLLVDGETKHETLPEGHENH